RLAQEGALVVCADVMDAKETADSLPASTSGRKGYSAHVDVTNTAEVEEVINRVRRDFGKLDIMVNNAGITHPVAEVIDIGDDWIDRVLATNVRGVIACSRAAARIMREQRSGRIINTASNTGKSAAPGWGVYSASKAAVIAITQVMALELAPFNVTVNCICPGVMVTDMMRTGFGQHAEQMKMNRDELIAQKAKSIPLGRMGTPEDMGAMVAWIASEDTAFTTGAAFNLTGGENTFF
ncbi:MAG: SDR family oxidoreductase, partial [Chloroflexota bacterium]|nr:SDR family oxidoreductase [Chloroflexota bacterium]